jgi:AcrR family transcriptional regulator
MSEIAEAAEVGRATRFAYFPTKEALVLDRAQVVAAQTIGVILAVKSRFYKRLVAGEPALVAAR